MIKTCNRHSSHSLRGMSQTTLFKSPSSSSLFRSTSSSSLYIPPPTALVRSISSSSILSNSSNASVTSPLSYSTSREKSYFAERLEPEDLNPNVVKAKYAVRGAIPSYADKLKIQLLKHPGTLPFESVINSNIGNPQQLGQKPLSFGRQVLSILEYPALLDHERTLVDSMGYAPDSIERAKTLLTDIGSIGAYSNSQGVHGIRQTVADFITNRDDGEVAYPDDIFLTAGASSAVSTILSILCKGQQTGVLIPIPQYPLYTATLTLNDATALPYYLDESNGWSTDINEISKVAQDSLEAGIKPTCLVVINPGNPTGSVLTVEAIKNVFDVAAKYGLVVIADEVYQDNIFPGSEFHSMKKILRILQKEVPNKYDNIQLASLHSCSKGLLGECGHRGGYCEFIGFTPEVKQVITKLSSISLCSSVIGQALVDLMCCPPKKGEPSYELDQHERQTIRTNHKKRSNKLYEMFNSLEGVTCQKPQGAMYMFPNIQLPFNAIKMAQNLDITPDEFYCRELLKATGICTVPGSGFGQQPGTYHVRTTFLAPGVEWMKRWEKFHIEFFEKYR
ncbi:hypothetical protein TBLA_0E04440 [Henningerozyma blattae CBS 6284]|uniref:Glutamate pyruvate transaminase n=1 Tax=Henningerozyma blattae (strain ATCC 34711 / CBS 6284 / DSM 70876 / NBRC 10599 / NRRL Y-10934 / UCD 77-7) TaxID=1071380 RepID=I2H546_HENB6|nr:hypothetical protein TBLA_0E04440 [Tetrapisispora blattae CBS 6284]CCH61498.1 hypothetical protein TBLA_0E04440 [Tetrapisispora blattae CBS 6284]